MELLGGLTSFDKVRGAIGATHNEVTDSMLFGAQLEAPLRLAVSDALGSAITYTTVIAEGTSTAADQTQAQRLQMLQHYATYFCSALVVKNLQLAIPELISDGKTQMRRFSDVDFDALAASHQAQASSAKAWLSVNVAQQAAAPVGLRALSVSKPDYDPTTAFGEG